MDDPRRLAGVALVALVAVALVSATVSSTVERSAVSVRGGLNTSEVPDEAWAAPPGLFGSSGTADERACIDGGELRSLAGGLTLVLLGGAALAFHRYDTLAAVGVVAMGVPVLVLLTAIAEACGSGGFGGLPTDGERLGVGGAASVVAAVTELPMWLLVLLGAVVAAVAVVATGDRTSVRAVLGLDRDPDPPAAPDDEDDAAVAVGRVAGHAADRIETGVDADNEVFRAWQTMTDHLYVDRPDSSTPAEFADAAVEAGLGRENVAELTELFEAVRYGGEAATAGREERAVAALRRIEADGLGRGYRPGEIGSDHDADDRRDGGDGR